MAIVGSRVPLAGVVFATVTPAAVELLLTRSALPSVPLFLAVIVTTLVATVAVTGRSGCLSNCAFSAAAIAVFTSAAEMAICTC